MCLCNLQTLRCQTEENGKVIETVFTLSLASSPVITLDDEMEIEIQRRE